MLLAIKEDKVRKNCLQALFYAFLFSSLFCTITCAEGAAGVTADTKIAVFYPDVRKPYNLFFDNIIEGIKNKTRAQVLTKSITKSEKPVDTQNWLINNNPAVLILLGGSLKSVVSELKTPAKILYGATFFSDGEVKQKMNGVSITPDPITLFNELHKLNPRIKFIHVVFHPETNGWLIAKARQAATKSHIKLVEHPVANTQQAATMYRTIAKTEKTTVNALWLLQHEPTLDEKSLVPKILADAWQNSQTVISSNPAHVRRGALLSILPDNVRLGEELAKATDKLVKLQSVGIKPMPSELLVINTRTAKHLELIISPTQESKFALVYPRKTNK